MTTDQLILRTIDRWEGGLSAHPLDRGGVTKYGITKRWYPGEDIVNLTKERAVAILRRDYWKPLAVDNLHPRAGWKAFDAAVVGGPSLGRRVKDIFLSSPDIEIGMTVAVDFLKNHFTRIAERDAKQQVFLKGWLRRAADRGEEIC